MVKSYQKKEEQELYSYLVVNKDWLPLMHYRDLHKKFKKVLCMFGVDLRRLHEDDLQRDLDALGIDPTLLTAGLIIESTLGYYYVCS